MSTPSVRVVDLARRSTVGAGLRFRGTVVHGDARGRLIGFPTANLELDDDSAFPADGVWVARVEVADWVAGTTLTRRAALSVGTNPTFDGTELRVEAHLLDFDGDLYGRQMSVQVLEHLRGTRRFDSVAELVREITADVDATRRWRP
ncbi:riboflavin kinase [Trujillonella endophytica]|uniref:Bifunctional riboflavin kinase/FMN adenylyltransferase n=1 Tax=Trujillonella endophytica TaxID=673521 RepID=A0A1H8QVA3_9ACTN|nr:riboflavin kinase [Trujillella endophytica]SEO57743.1 Riboflavin kinase [Trujillella endophytica]